jgi:DNA-binding phage protein
MRILDAEDVVRLLRSEVKRAGGQAAWASKTGLNRIVINKVLNGKTLPTKKIIKALKLRIVFISELDSQRSK